MANSNMLSFGVSFDWSQAVDQKKAQEVLDRAQRIVTSQPIVLTAKYDQSALAEFVKNYSGSIDKIKERISELNAAWSKMSFSDKFDVSGNLINKLQQVNIGTDKEPTLVGINPAKAEAEIAQLTAALKTYGKTLTDIIHDRERALEEEARLTQRYYEDELRELGKVINARIDAYNKEQRLYQQRRQMLEQTFFSGSKGYSAISSYSDLPKDVEVAVNKQIGLYNRLDSEIQKLTAQYEKYKALQAEAGGKGYEDEINKILKEREALMKQQAAIATTADEANAKRVKQKELEEQHDQKILALQQRIQEVKSRAIPEEATTQVERATRAYQEQLNALGRIKKAIADVESKMSAAKAAGDQDKYNQLMREREILYGKQISAEEDFRQRVIAVNDAIKARDDAKEEERKRLIEQQTKAYDAQAKKIDDLNKRIQAQKDARDAMRAPSKSLADIVQAYKDQKDKVDNLKTSLLSATAAREHFDSIHAKGTEYAKAHIAAQEKERALTQQLADEEAKLTTKLEQKLAAERANAAQVERDDALIRRQLASVDALASKIQEYQSAQLKVGALSTEVDRVTTAYVNQSTSIKTLRKEYENAVNARKAFSDADKKNLDGTANKAYIEALQKEEKLAKDLNVAEQRLLNTQQRRLELLRQIGLSGNVEQYGGHWSIGALTDQAAVDAQIQKYNQLKETIATLGVEYERLKALHREAGTDVTQDKNANNLLKQRIAARKELDQITRTADQAETEALRKHEALVASIQAKARKRNEAQKQRVAKLREEQKALLLQENTINNIQKKLAALTAQKMRTDFLGDPVKFKQLNDEIDRLQKLLDKVSGKQEKAKKAAESHTKGLEYQKGVLDRLIQRMAVYASVGALVGFAQKVREITAEFELQRVALGAIINDQAKGNALFSEIKSFALKSPIKILDLTKYTKQVAAYRIETDKLFDTTKRLADVSVGLGVDMQRLVLAFGQVKAATYLRASELRQFTEAGIPMLELLSEKFTQLEGQMVSTADVMKRISKRGVEFKDVEQVLLDMTSAGGMFYNMQEKMGNTLYGMWAKLGDAASIMYDQIGNTESINKGMKSVIKALTDIMRNWDSWAKSISLTAATMGIGVLAMKTYLMYQKYTTLATKANTAADIAARREIINKSVSLKTLNTVLQKCGMSTNRATAATLAFGTALRMIGSIGLMVLVTAVTYLVEKIFQARKEATALTDELNKVAVENFTEQQKTINNFERLAEVAVNAADGSRKQREALEELRRTYGKMVPAEQLELSYLRQLKGDYDAVTMSIREYIQEQMKRKAIDTAMETTQPKIIEATNKMKENFEGIVFDDTLNQFTANLREIIAKNIKDMDVIGGSYTMFDAYTEALESVGLSWERLEKISGKSESALYKDFANVGDYMRRQEQVLQSLSEQYTSAGTSIVEFSNQVKESATRVSEYIPKLGGQVVDRDSYLGRQLVSNESIKTVVDNLKFAFAKTTVAWDNEWTKLIDTIDESQPEILSSIDFAMIEARLKEEMKRLDLTEEQQKQLGNTLTFVREQKRAYQELVPSTNVIAKIKDGVSQIALALDFSEGVDDVDQFLMKNNESVKNYIDKLEENMKDYAQIVQELTTLRLLQGGLLSVADQEQLDKAEKISEFLKQAIEYVKQFYKESESANTRTRQQVGKDKLQEWNEYSSVIEKVYKKYEELQKVMTDDEALAHINEYYAESLDYLAQQGLYLKSLPKDSEEYKNALRRVKNELQGIIEEYDLASEWAAKKHVADINVKIGTVDVEDLKKGYEKILKSLSDEIAQSKAAKDFFDNIFSQTKDYDMAMELTMSIYGDTGENYQQQIIDQIRTAFGAGEKWEIDVSPAINVQTGAVDYNKLEELMNVALKDENLQQYREQMKKIIDEGRKFSAERAKQWMKDLSKARTFAQQRVDLAKYTAERIKEIETDPGLSEDAKSSLKTQYLAREAKEAAKLEYEAFKDTPMYVQMFENLENATTASLEAMNTKLVELQKNLKDLDPAQLKEIQKRMAEIQDQLAERNLNPFGWLKKAAKEMKEWRTELESATKAGGEQDLAKFGLTGYEAGIKTVEELERAISSLTDKEREASKAATDFMKGDEYQSAVALVDTLQAKYDTMTAERRESDEGKGLEQQLVAARENLQTQNDTLDTLTSQADALRLILNYLTAQQGAYSRIRAKMSQAWKGADKIKDEVFKVADAAYDMAEAFGASDDALALFQDIKTALSTVYDFTKSVTTAVKFMGEATKAEIKSVEGASVILAAITAALQVATAIFNLFANANARKKEREIKSLQKQIDALEYSYEKLADASDRVFGSDYISNYNQRLKNLQAQQAAALKQAQLEREKGKKADADKVQEYENNARDAADEIVKMQSEIAERLTGTDLGSAARDFASAWLDAYISFESTTGAIKEKFNDMIKNMIIEGAMGQIVQAVLNPFYDKIKEAALSGGRLDAREIVDLTNEIPDYTTQITDGLQVFANQLESLGMDLHELGDTGEFTGIARDIASASEESITGLAAMINTQNYYISNVPLIYQEVVLIRQLLSGGSVNTPTGGNTTTLDVLQLQNEYLSHLPAIHTNTEAIAERCERAASACENIADSLNKVITYGGQSKGYAVVIS